MERIGTSSKAVLLALSTVCVLMGHGGVLGAGCCLGPGGLTCVPQSTRSACTSLGGLYAAGSGPASWICVQQANSLYKCVCPVGTACGDPHITGFDGSNYMLWGQQDATYNILSERNHQVNARLFDDPAPSGNDRPGHASHALFIDAVGVMINDARIIVRMVTADAKGVEPELASIISSSPAASKNARAKILAVSTFAADGTTHHTVWTGKPMAQEVDSQTSYTFTDAAHVAISSSQLSLAVHLRHNHHLDFQVNAIAVSWSNVHGVLGQTYAAAFGSRGTAVAGGGQALGVAKTPIINKQLKLEGKEEDYVTSGLLSADDKFSRFIVGGSKLHVLATVSDDAAAVQPVVSRKVLMKANADLGGVVVGGPQDMVEMVWSDAGVMGDP